MSDLIDKWVIIGDSPDFGEGAILYTHAQNRTEAERVRDILARDYECTNMQIHPPLSGDAREAQEMFKNTLNGVN